MIAIDLVDGGTRVSVQLPPAGSAFIVLRGQADNDRIVSIEANDMAVLPSPRVGLLSSRILIRHPIPRKVFVFVACILHL